MSEMTVDEMRERLFYDPDKEAGVIVEKINARVAKARKEWDDAVPETKEEAKAIIQPLMNDCAKQMTDDLVKLLIKGVIKGVLDANEQEQKAGQN